MIAISPVHGGLRSEFIEDTPQHVDRHVAVRLVHHVRTEPGLVEEVDERHGAVGSPRAVFDGAGQHLRRGVEVARGGVGSSDSSVPSPRSTR